MSKESKEEREERELQEHTARVNGPGRSASDVAHGPSVFAGDALQSEKIASVIAFGESSPFHKELSEQKDIDGHKAVDMKSLKSEKPVVRGNDGSDIESSAPSSSTPTVTFVEAAKAEQSEEQRTDDSEPTERKQGGE